MRRTLYPEANRGSQSLVPQLNVGNCDPETPFSVVSNRGLRADREPGLGGVVEGDSGEARRRGIPPRITDSCIQGYGDADLAGEIGPLL